MWYSSLKRSGMACVNEGSHSFTCHPYCGLWNEPNLPLPPQPQSITALWLVLVLNVASRVVSGTRKFDHGLTQLLHADLHWLDVPECIKYKLCMMMRRCQDGTAPQYLALHWSPVSETASQQHLRSAASHQLTVSPHRRTTDGGRAFAVAGPSTWNSLPKRLLDPYAVFARLLKTFFFSEY